MLRVVCAAAAMMVPTIPSAAQTLAAQTRRLDVDGEPSRVISINPFLPLFGYFAAEFEHRIRPSVSWAISGSHIELDDRYTNLDAKVRLYPTERGLRGFNIASSLGYARVHDQSSSSDCVIDILTSSDCGAPKPFSTGTFAVEIGYQWLLGPSRSTAVTVGGGAKRYLGSSRFYGTVPRVLPTMRLNVGYAF
ncbi:MAG: hypothetical protein IT353_19000 [Gemmatimonadaceae bacterium]|nr:hypothetical protein [Gemmatimonadaceae bacterium]